MHPGGPGLARPIRRWLVVGVLALAALGAWLVYGQGYQRGLGMHPILQQELEALRERRRESDRLIAQLSQEMVKLRQGAMIDRDAARQVRETVIETNEEMAALREEIAFYRSLMTPTAAEQGLGIRSLELRAASEPGCYEYELVLQQRASKHRTLKGEFDVSVAGQINGADVVLSLEQLTAGEAAQSSRFQFKYFQKLQGDLRLPEGFEPASIAVSARTWSRPVVKVERNFVWLVRGD